MYLLTLCLTLQTDPNYEKFLPILLLVRTTGTFKAKGVFSASVFLMCVAPENVFVTCPGDKGMELVKCPVFFCRRDFACLITFWRKGVWWRLASQFKLCLSCLHWKYLSFLPCDTACWQLDSFPCKALLWIAVRHCSLLHRNTQAIKN